VKEWTVSTNLISFAPAQAAKPIFGWPMNGQEAQLIATMEPGDLIVPKFAQLPGYERGGQDAQVEYQRGVCEAVGLDYEQEVERYNKLVAWGQGAAPYIWTVTERLPDDDRFPSGEPWACVGISVEQLPAPFSTKEFLMLRAMPEQVARQFKATAAAGRHIQELPAGTAAQVREYGQSSDRGDALRRFSLIRAADPSTAVEKLQEAGRPPVSGDRCFLAHDERAAGLYDVTSRVTGPRDARERMSRKPQETRK
jgi:hypothetical protein